MPDPAVVFALSPPSKLEVGSKKEKGQRTCISSA
jgi:hypothetical protein